MDLASHHQDEHKQLAQLHWLNRRWTILAGPSIPSSFGHAVSMVCWDWHACKQVGKHVWSLHIKCFKCMVGAPWSPLCHAEAPNMCKWFMTVIHFELGVVQKILMVVLSPEIVIFASSIGIDCIPQNLSLGISNKQFIHMNNRLVTQFGYRQPVQYHIHMTELFWP
jgi:hypothetical protein